MASYFPAKGLDKDEDIESFLRILQNDSGTDYLIRDCARELIELYYPQEYRIDQGPAE